MSGGYYDHAYWKVEEFATSLAGTNDDPRRAAFKELLLLVAQAMHDIEWVDSDDYGPGDEIQSIDKIMAFLTADPSTIIKARAYDKLADKLRKYLDLKVKPV